MNKWLKEHLVCPRDKKFLEFSDDKLICPDGHTYPVIEDVPIMLVEDAEHTHGYINQTLEKVSKILSEKREKDVSADDVVNKNGIDKFVQSGSSIYFGHFVFFGAEQTEPLPDSRNSSAAGKRRKTVGHRL